LEQEDRARFAAEERAEGLQTSLLAANDEVPSRREESARLVDVEADCETLTERDSNTEALEGTDELEMRNAYLEY
jgi:hypothetical protein